MQRHLLPLNLINDALWLFLAIPELLYAQQPSGVVSAVEGQAQVSRPASTGPTALLVKDGPIIRDVVDTREKSPARILFGGNATVTIRELSEMFAPRGVHRIALTRSAANPESRAVRVISMT